MTVWAEVAAALARDHLAALVSLTEVRGSSPREAGARMVVQRDGGFRGSIGGGALEHAALAEALTLLAACRPAARVRRTLLGPDLGQCCGGQVSVAIEVFVSDDLQWIGPLAAAEAAGGPLDTVGRRDASGRLVRRLARAEEAGERERFGIAQTPVLLFGAGHVGRAVVLALAPLPFRVTWVDSRPDAFPAHVPAGTMPLETDDPAALAGRAVAGALVAVMTHSHPLDLAIVAAALAHEACPYVGLIGSATKRARFASQLLGLGLTEAALARLVCPIGGGLVHDKSPAVIAAVTVVELLGVRERLAAAIS